jgi:DNA replication licensing factor MCM6
MHETTGARANSAQEGVTGLKSLGVRELNYKLCFLACAVHLADKDGWSHFREHDDEEGGAEEFDAETSARISSMASSPNLYQRMVNSICPTVFGHEEVCVCVFVCDHIPQRVYLVFAVLGVGCRLKSFRGWN